jgi:3-oxoacyl-[acyl-carrier protein] reductase
MHTTVCQCIHGVQWFVDAAEWGLRDQRKVCIPMAIHHDFHGRAALVTGAANGIGRAIALQLLAGGARVHAADINGAGLSLVSEAGAVTHVFDIGDRAACHAAVQRIADAEGRIDLLVNSAGGSLGKAKGTVESVTEEDWHAVFDANTHGAFWLCQAVAPHMKQARFGRIVNIASGAGLRPALNGSQPYCAAKHALVGMTKQMSFELGPHGVTVNAVAPGFVLSGSPWAQESWARYGTEGQQRLMESLHTRRIGQAQDIAHAAMFFLCEDSGWITGQVLSVDGGRS